jgi:hypothetical protein
MSALSDHFRSFLSSLRLALALALSSLENRKEEIDIRMYTELLKCQVLEEVPVGRGVQFAEHSLKLLLVRCDPLRA